MSVSPTLILPVSTGSQVDAGSVRVEQAAQSLPGSGPRRENGGVQSPALQADLAQDEVKVQIEPPGEIAVYKFLDQNGTLVLQVPPQQLLELAQAIEQELAQEAAANNVTGSEGGKSNGH